MGSPEGSPGKSHALVDAAAKRPAIARAAGLPPSPRPASPSPRPPSPKSPTPAPKLTPKRPYDPTRVRDPGFEDEVDTKRKLQSQRLEKLLGSEQVAIVVRG